MNDQFDLEVELQKADDERRRDEDERIERRDNTIHKTAVAMFATLITTLLLG
jgi:hypothetical protein